MTPAEIYATVQDVPREAWPEGFKFWNVTKIKYFYTGSAKEYGRTVENVSDSTAYIAFVGSMAKYQIDRGGQMPSARITGGYRVLGKDRSFTFYPTLLEALAAACKGVV